VPRPAPRPFIRHAGRRSGHLLWLQPSEHHGDAESPRAAADLGQRAAAPPDSGEDAGEPKLLLKLLRRHPQLPSNRLFRRRGSRGGPVNGEICLGEKRWERERELSRELGFVTF
jgi:hypothetical protein